MTSSEQIDYPSRQGLQFLILYNPHRRTVSMISAALQYCRLLVFPSAYEELAYVQISD
jgi:hypothetical protein